MEGEGIQISSSFSPISGSSSYSLSKKVISNQSAQELNDGSFNEVAISEEKFDSEKINRIYNDLFYKIPKRGKKSHESILAKSTDYINPEINERLDASIKIIDQELIQLSSTLINETVKSTTIHEHPLYKNGLILQQGANNTVSNPTSDKWYIQQGMKRKITGASWGYWTRVLRQAAGEIIYDKDNIIIDINLSPNFRVVSAEDLNTIDNGEEISNGAHLSISPLLGIEQTDLYSEVEIKLSCLGEEKFYKFKNGEEGYDYYLENYPELDGKIMGGYWWFDENGSCEIEVQTDIDPTPTFTPNIYNFTLSGPKYSENSSKTVTISRDPQFYLDSHHNGTNDPLKKEFYKGSTTSVIETRQEYGMDLPPVEVLKEWGPGSRFPSITYIKPGSRVAFTLKKPTAWDSNGNISPIDGGLSHQMYNIDNSIYNSNQANIFDKVYNTNSNYETRMIYKGCNGPLATTMCYGSIGQYDTLQKYFNDPGFNYYRTQAGPGSNIKVYGQPIIKVKGNYAIFGYRYRSYGVDWNVFYDLETGESRYIKNKNLNNDVTGYKRYSKRYFNWTPEDYGTYVNNPTLYFPGIQGTKVNNSGAKTELLNGDRTFNNPGNKGSNFKQTNWMLENLKRG